jgi:glycosyltransferase involved in cell wall biosynthesis
MNFEYSFINHGYYEDRGIFRSCIKIIKDVLRTDYKKIIFPGWEIKELLLLSLVTPKVKNCVAVESSILETKKTPIIWWLKKIFLSRMSLGLPSGDLQAAIFYTMNFSGKIVLTNGVGVLNSQFYSNERALCKPKKSEINAQVKYIYVGRIAEEKNLEFMCDVFVQKGKNLTIVGYGPLEEHLKNKYEGHITFLGAIDNEKLNSIYEQYDVFVLPSKSEPWGLVIEEALCSGLVIIASNMVGSKNELILKKNTGVIFEFDNPVSLINAIDEVEANYEYYERNVKGLDKITLLEEKIRPYTEIIDEEIN